MFFNLLIAVIIVEYGDYFKMITRVLNKYQLKDIISLWKTYDPHAKGFLRYDSFWKFSSQIAIIFGVPTEELLDISNKKSFLTTLAIPLYESKSEKVFCYQFHDVITELAKISVTIKYGEKKYIILLVFLYVGDIFI